MESHENYQLDRIASAARRLDAALTRLESAVAARLETGMAGGMDRERLAEELRVCRAEYTALHEVTAHVESRLEGVIGRVRTLLAE